VIDESSKAVRDEDVDFESKEKFDSDQDSVLIVGSTNKRSKKFKRKRDGVEDEIPSTPIGSSKIKKQKGQSLDPSSSSKGENHQTVRMPLGKKSILDIDSDDEEGDVIMLDGEHVGAGINKKKKKRMGGSEWDLTGGFKRPGRSGVIGKGGKSATFFD
jgi:hypothetical protein